MRAAFAVSILILFAAILLAEAHAVTKVVHEDAFSVIGIEVRTNNAREATSDGVIGKQWQEFFQDGVLQKIPNKIGSSIYAVYGDYAGDYRAEYSFMIGAKVADGTPAPTGMVLQPVAAGNYVVLTSEKGLVGKVVAASWQKVWRMEDQKELGGTRAYKTDYELYDQRATDPHNSQVDLYIGVK